MVLSRHIKESIKTALAMTIVYAFALWAGWDKPYWAGLSVAFISLSTVGHSLNKGVKRMLGTLFGFVVSLTIIALFVQDRWWFIVIFSIWLGFCTYKYSSRQSYFWFIAGLVTAIICFDAGTDPVNAFNTAILRVQETALGVLTYTLISVFVWPATTGSELDSSSRELITTQRKLYSSYLLFMKGLSGADDKLQIQEIQTHKRFILSLDAARTDTTEVREISGQWQCFQDQTTQLMEAMDRLHDALNEVSELDLKFLTPTMDSIIADHELRFAQIERMLAGNMPETEVQIIKMSYNKEAVEALSHFHKAAFSVAWVQLQHIEQLTRNIFNTVSSIKGFGPEIGETPRRQSPWVGLLPDPDAIAAAISIVAMIWTAYFLWIYFAVPGGTGLVSLIASMGIVFAVFPQLSALSILPTFLISVVFGGVIHVFIMPHLPGFSGLGVMIFVVTYSLCYLFPAPQKLVNRALGLAMFVGTISVANEQTYSFLSVVDAMLMYTIMLIIFALMVNIPFSARPEKAFLRLLGRFFHSSEYLLGSKPYTSHNTWLHSWRKAFHSKEIKSLPAKIIVWSRAINTKTLEGTSAEQLQILTTHIHAVAFRIQELSYVYDKHQSNVLVKDLFSDFHSWRLKVQSVFQLLSNEPMSVSAESIRHELTEIIDHLEDKIEQTLNKTDSDETLSDLERENFYLLLGAYRSLSETTIQYAEIAESINWKPWKEEVFA